MKDEGGLHTNKVEYLNQIYMSNYPPVSRLATKCLAYLEEDNILPEDEIGDLIEGDD